MYSSLYVVLFISGPICVEKHNFRELLSLPCREGEFYSIIISDLKDFVQPDFIQSKVYLYDENNEIKLAKCGAPMSRYALSDDYLNTPLGIREKPVLQFATPLDIYSTLT